GLTGLGSVKNISERKCGLSNEMLVRDTNTQPLHEPDAIHLRPSCKPMNPCWRFRLARGWSRSRLLRCENTKAGFVARLFRQNRPTRRLKLSANTPQAPTLQKLNGGRFRLKAPCHARGLDVFRRSLGVGCRDSAIARSLVQANLHGAPVPMGCT